MIVAMKKLLLLALESDKSSLLEELGKLGVVEVTVTELADSRDRVEAQSELSNLDRVCSMVGEYKCSAADRKLFAEAASYAKLNGSELFAEADRALEHVAALRKQALDLNRDQELLSAWGNFDLKRLDQLKQQGVSIACCRAPHEVMERFQAEGEDLVVTEITHEKTMSNFVVTALHPIPETLEYQVAFPAQSLVATQRMQGETAQKILDAERVLQALYCELPRLQEERRRVAGTLDFLVARDAMQEHGAITVMQGFVPSPDLEKVEEAARIHGWAISSEDANPMTEAVPVLLKPPTWAKPILPLFDFLGISVGYDEFDVSGTMLLFFAVFFSMIINDAGYGFLMLLGSIAMLFAFRKNRKALLAAKLMTLLSFCSTLWGVLCGAYFGMEGKGIAFLAPGENQTAHLELVCFVLALAHLALGRLWKMAGSKTLRAKIGQLGWIPILFADFMIVYRLLVAPGPIEGFVPWCFGGGLLLVVLGDVDWKNVGEVCNFPFSLLNSFTDTLSYVRLFAVGMSGSYMALSFNDMAMNIWHSAWWGIPIAIVILLLGHALTFILALMGVLVHGVRLNTLEFSNHAGIRWSGQSFRPLCTYIAPESASVPEAKK